MNSQCAVLHKHPKGLLIPCWTVNQLEAPSSVSTMKNASRRLAKSRNYTLSAEQTLGHERLTFLRFWKTTKGPTMIRMALHSKPPLVRRLGTSKAHAHRARTLIIEGLIMSQEITKAPSLNTLLKDPTTTLEDVQQHLAALDFDARLAASMSLGKKAQRNLYNLAANNPCTLEDMVPADVPPKTPVVLEGKNSLPIFTRFQKIFAWNEDKTLLYGFNEGFTRKFIGPGYFIAHLTDDTLGQEGWTSHAHSVVNYHVVPPNQDAVPTDWPKVVPNTQGLQRFVYRGMNDFMRKITDEISIGGAYKGDKDFDSYFVLVRRPVDNA